MAEDVGPVWFDEAIGIDFTKLGDVPIMRFGTDFAEGVKPPRFAARYFCSQCGPTNRVMSGADGLICTVCSRLAALRIMEDVKFLDPS